MFRPGWVTIRFTKIFKRRLVTYLQSYYTMDRDLILAIRLQFSNYNEYSAYRRLDDHNKFKKL